jgi:hypothetical protein
MQTRSSIMRSFVALGLVVMLLTLSGCDATTEAQQASRSQATVIGSWRDESPQIPVTQRIVRFQNNGVFTDTWVFFDMDNVKCTIWGTFRVLDYSNGTFADVNYTHRVGTCDDITVKSGSIKLDVLDSNHILFGNGSFTRIQ